MKKNNKTKLIISTLILFILISFFFINSIIGKEDKFINLKSLINKNQKEFIKRYIFPYKFISQQDQLISKLQMTTNLYLSEMELKTKNLGMDIETIESNINLSNNKILKKYHLNSGFYAGINNPIPGSGYIDFFDDNLFILSSRGVLAFAKNFTDEDVSLENLLEGKRGYSAMIKTTVMVLIMKIRALEKKIKNEDDEKQRDIILAQLSAYSSYLSAISITFDTDDKSTRSRIASFAKKL